MFGRVVSLGGLALALVGVHLFVRLGQNGFRIVLGRNPGDVGGAHAQGKAAETKLSRGSLGGGA